MRSNVFILAVILLFSSFVSAKYLSMSVSDGGAISGKVTYAGKYKGPQKIAPTSDKEVCGSHGPIYSEDLIVDSLGGVKNVVVTLTNITRGRPIFSTDYRVLDQKGCVYDPHVMVVTVGQKMKVLNSDGIIHNVHSNSAKNPPFNFAQPGSVKEMEIKPFQFPELVKITCDVHGWMSSYLWVSEHPYTVVTGKDGTFEIEDIPKGKYKVKFWHETLGEIVKEVEVDKEKVTELNLLYPAKEEVKKK